MKPQLVFAVALFFTTQLFSATIYVPDDYKTIQAAIDASTAGDVIIVRPGTYIENIDFAGKAVTVRSELGPAATMIDGNRSGSAVVFRSGESASSVIEGFTISNGSGVFNSAWGNVGGGVYCTSSSPSIQNNVITGSFTDSGSGIFCYDSSATIKNNWIKSNEHLRAGGGIFCENSDPTIINNVISGIRVGGSDIATQGAGMFLENSSPRFINNTVVDNDTGSSFTGIPGEGGGIYCSGNSAPEITNTIIWSNYPNQIHVFSGNPIVTYSNIENGWTGTGNINAVPMLFDLAGGDCHLTWQSPCRNAGTNTAVSDPVDFEGDPRITDGTVDMGADEFYYHLYRSGSVTPGAGIEIRVIGVPGVKPVRLALGSGVQDPPQATPYGDLHLLLPPLFMADIGAVPANGVLAYPATVPSSWPAGSHKPLQALVGPFGNPNTVLTNLLLLVVE